MIEIILLLVGGDYLQRRWAFLMVIGVVWLAAGIFLCIDALDGKLVFPLETFALLVLLECLVAFSLASSGLSLAPRLRLIQAAALAVVAVLILSPWDLGDVLIAIVARHSVRGRWADPHGDGLARPFSGLAGHPAGWCPAAAAGRHVASCRGSRAMSTPFPTASAWASPVRGWRCCGQVLGLRRWPAGSAIAPHLVHARAGGAGLQLPPVPPTPPGRKPLVVRVWTALGTADHPVRRPAARPLHRRGRCEGHDLDRPFRPGAAAGPLHQPLPGGGDRPFADRVPTSVPCDAGQ